MYIAKVPNRNSPPAILIRESYREGGAPKTRTVANISKWKPARIEALRQLLKGNVDLGEAQQFEITRSKPHGHVAAVLGTLRKVGLERIIHSRQRRERDLPTGCPSTVSEGDVPAAVEFGRVAAAPVNTLRQQPHRCQEISVCF